MENYHTPNFIYANMMPEKAQGSRVWDTEGREYIDLAGGIAVNALGHCHPDLQAALQQQAAKLWHISNYFTSKPAQELAKKMVQNTFADKVFLANSGAEANEAALKLARKTARDRFGEGKSEIIACVNAFHGRTLFTVSVGGQPKYSQDFAPLPQGITHIPFNDIAALEAAVSDKTCAVIIEPIQGESGVLPAENAFLQRARELCSQFQAALIFDEVQTGMGRTGQLFAYQGYGIEPDILTSAKALGAGIPIGAMLAKNEFAEHFTPGSHGSTFGGNPLACAVASTAFDIINAPETLENVRLQGEKIRTALQEIAQNSGVFQMVRGQGLLIGAVLSAQYENQAASLVSVALENGLLVLGAGGNVIRFAPSLLLNDEDLHEAMVRFAHAVKQWQSTLSN